MFAYRLIAFLLVAGIGPSLAALNTQQGPASAAERSDIVLVLVDDMTEADWRSLPETRQRFPAVFPNYINTDPLCCPSRVSILRGQYAHTHGTWSNEGPDGGWQSFRRQEGETIAVVLQAAGYHTGLIGKYLNGYPARGGVPPGWSYWFAWADGPDRYFSWRAVEGDQIRSYGTADDDYTTDVFALKAVNFIEDAPPDRPVFAYVAPHAPHGPATPAPRHKRTCGSEPLGSRSKPSFNEPDMSDKPAYMQHEPRKIDKLIELDRKRQCSLKAVDELVVAVVDALETRGRPYDIIFASDNGYLLGEHRGEQKRVPYEESIRTTMRAAGPDFPAGEDHRLVANIDLAPTLAAIAGAEPRDDWDGRSLRRQDGLDREAIGLESFDRSPREDPIPPYHGFRSKTGIVYVEYVTGEIELYDLSKDPYQLDNLAAGKTAADFATYHARAELLNRCHAATCWTAEDALLVSAAHT